MEVWSYNQCESIVILGVELKMWELGSIHPGCGTENVGVGVEPFWVWDWKSGSWSLFILGVELKMLEFSHSGRGTENLGVEPFWVWDWKCWSLAILGVGLKILGFSYVLCVGLKMWELESIHTGCGTENVGVQLSHTGCGTENVGVGP